MPQTRQVYLLDPKDLSPETIAVTFAIRLVVLALVAHQIAQRETVVGGDEVDARARTGDGGRRRPSAGLPAHRGRCVDDRRGRFAR